MVLVFRTPYYIYGFPVLYYLFVYLKSFKELLFLFAIVSGKRMQR